MKKHTVLFLHSALGTSQDLRPLMDLIAERGHTTLAMDFSGHGKAKAFPSEFRIDFFARELDSYLKTHKLQDISVFGHSMGGYVALYHAANFEDSPFRHIFTYGTKFNWTAEAVAKELPMLSPTDLAQRFPEHARALEAKHGDRWKQLMLSTAHMIQNLEKLDGLTREDLLDLETQVTLMLGDQDRMVTSEETQTTRSWLHHASMKTISHSKHDLERSNLKEISQVVLDSLD